MNGENFILPKKLTVMDYIVLRGPLVSGRQSPGTLALALILGIFLQSLTYYLEYSVAGQWTNYPHKDQILAIHFWVTAILVCLLAIYAIPFIYMRGQKMQYLVSILLIQNLGISFYIMSLFLIGENTNLTEQSLLTFTWFTLLLAFLLLVVTSIRFYILLRKGAYLSGSKKAKQRAKFETSSYIPAAIVGSTGLFFIIQFIVRVFDLSVQRDTFIIILGFLLFYTILFVLPEQLVILYCKFRFKGFNFNKKGNLNSVNRTGKGS